MVSEHAQLCVLISECCAELKFLNDDCNLLHGDISMGNIVIVRFLPSIILAAFEPEDPEDDALTGSVIDSGKAEAERSLSILSSTGDVPTSSGSLLNVPSGGSVAALEGEAATGDIDEGPLSIISLAGNTPTSAASALRGIVMEIETFFNVPSGGSVIDFDYSRARGEVSKNASVSTGLFLLLSYIDYM